MVFNKCRMTFSMSMPVTWKAEPKQNEGAEEKDTTRLDLSQN